MWRRLAAHDGPLQSLCICANQRADAAFATGGDDGVVLLWGGAYTVLRRLDLNAICQRSQLDAYGRPRMLPPRRGIQVSAVCWEPDDACLLVGTCSNEILRIDVPTERAAILTQGHAGGWVDAPAPPTAATAAGAPGQTRASREGPEREWARVRALAEHPRQPRFATVGDDCSVKVWGLLPHGLQSVRRLQQVAKGAPIGERGARPRVDGHSERRGVLLQPVEQLLVPALAVHAACARKMREKLPR